MQALEARPLPLGRVGALRRPNLHRLFNPQTPRLCCGGRRLRPSALQQSFPACQVRGLQPWLMGSTPASSSIKCARSK